MSTDANNAVLAADPPVFLDADCADRLQNLAIATPQRHPDVAERLLHEIERATLLPPGAVPANVVTIGSEVTFRDNTLDATRSVTLVLPGEADIARRRVSVLTPIGAALIGLTEGAEISWATRRGEVRRLTILKVAPPA